MPYYFLLSHYYYKLNIITLITNVIMIFRLSMLLQ